MKLLIATLALLTSAQAFATTAYDVFVANGANKQTKTVFTGVMDKKNKCALKISQLENGNIKLDAKVWNKKKTYLFSEVYSQDNINNLWDINLPLGYLSYAEPIVFVKFISFDPSNLRM